MTLTDREYNQLKAAEKVALETMICAGPGCDKPLDPVIVAKHNDAYHATECCKRAHKILDGSAQEDDEQREKFTSGGSGSRPYRIHRTK